MTRERHPKVVVQFSTGTFETWTLRQLCGWARQHGARVQTVEGWPVVNGKIRSCGAPASTLGVVLAPDLNSHLAYWHVRVSSEAQGNPERAAQEHHQAEQAWIVRS
jgi:hypothetical protein